VRKVKDGELESLHTGLQVLVDVGHDGAKRYARDASKQRRNECGKGFGRPISKADGREVPRLRDGLAVYDSVVGAGVADVDT
jgi:hypothetical protein